MSGAACANIMDLNSLGLLFALMGSIKLTREPLTFNKLMSVLNTNDMLMEPQV